jgi:hypothetical protein
MDAKEHGQNFRNDSNQLHNMRQAIPTIDTIKAIRAG